MEYEGRLYVYGTNDHQQYTTVGKSGKNTYEHIKSLVCFSTEDMVNWTYHGEINVKGTFRLTAPICNIREVPAGRFVSYSGTYETTKDTKIAVLQIGYADGLRRNLSNKGYVIINGKKVPIIGNVCMDGFMADVTELDNVKVGDDVYIWDNESITLEEIAKMCGTINYEIMCTVSERVPRIFIK